MTPAAIPEPPPGLIAPACVYPWAPDQGDGTFRNPVLCADYSDPDVVRVGEDFYLTASSFNCAPGLPILHSRDLVNWTILGHALKSIPGARYQDVQPGCGVWAPAIRHHAGKFWIFFPTPDEGIYVTTAANPAGPWSEPHLVQAGKGLIDPCPLWDDDGQAYLVHAYAKSRAGIKDLLRVCPMAPDGSRLLGEGKIVFQDSKRHPTMEGPKFMKQDGWYYILAPAGGVEHGWQVALRSRNVYGPYEDKIVLERGSTAINGPHQGALVDLPNGDWWFLHFQEAGAYGRIIHLQPVSWKDGWPLMGVDYDGNGIGEPVMHHAKPAPSSTNAMPQTSDEFDAAALGLQWQWYANPHEGWCSLSARPGWLRLFAHPAPKNSGNLAHVPHLLLQKLPAREFGATTLLDFSQLAVGDKAGVIVVGADYSLLAIERTAGGFQVVRATCLNALGSGTEKTEATVALASKPAFLRVSIKAPGVCGFSFSTDGEQFTPLGKPFTAHPGRWIGAKVGLFSLAPAGSRLAGHADFDWFRLE